MVRNDLRNVAIIAHVDHGKTTLVDALLRQSGAFRDNQAVAERVMDSGDIERERGITILAKNCSCTYKGVKINIVDTPGHADFGGEVERVLKMVNGVLLLVDAAEGCMPQTRFVLQKALQQNLSLVVAINKIDRPDARIKEVIDEVLYLLMDLGATDEQLDCPMLFCCGRDGTASLDPDVPGTDLVPLFDTLLSTIKPPEGDPEAPFQMLVSSVDYNEFVGRIGIGRIQNGVAKVGEEVVVCDWHNPDLKMRGRLTKLYDFQANGRQPCDNITAGDIVAFSGLPDVTIGNTLCSPSNIEPLPFVKINDPTVEMTFSVNDSPLAGREGKYVTSRQIRDRLQKELLKDVALKVEDSATTDSFRVMGRGEMHLSILIETMRREGYELQVSPPHVLTKVIDGKTYEPMEHVVIDVPTQYQGAVMTGLGQRKAILQQMESLGSDRVRLEFRMPSRGLFGYRNQFLTDTHGEGIINQIFDGYDVWAGMIANRSTGSLVSFETGEAVTYGLFNAQQRGTLLVGPGEKVYEGMVIGYTASGEDVDVNVCKTKHLTNTRSSGSDDALRLIPISKLSLEGCLEFRMPSRGLFGYRNQFLTDTHGEGILNTIFDGYEEWCGDITCRSTGSLVSYDTGDAVTYGLFNAQGRGTLIVTPGEKVYEGMVVGYTPTGEDITVNVCKTKHLTNTRASGSDDALRLVPVSKFSLEGCLEFLAPDELLEVTPENLRIRKRILSHDQRMKATHKKG